MLSPVEKPAKRQESWFRFQAEDCCIRFFFVFPLWIASFIVPALWYVSKIEREHLQMSLEAANWMGTFAGIFFGTPVCVLAGLAIPSRWYLRALAIPAITTLPAVFWYAISMLLASAFPPAAVLPALWVAALHAEASRAPFAGRTGPHLNWQKWNCALSILLASGCVAWGLVNAGVRNHGYSLLYGRWSLPLPEAGFQMHVVLTLIVCVWMACNYKAVRWMFDHLAPATES